MFLVRPELSTNRGVVSVLFCDWKRTQRKNKIKPGLDRYDPHCEAVRCARASCGIEGITTGSPAIKKREV